MKQAKHLSHYDAHPTAHKQVRLHSLALYHTPHPTRHAMSESIETKSQTPGGNGDATANTSASTAKAVIKNVDMSDEMQQWTVDIAQEALKQFSVEKDVAAHIKRQMDSKCGPTWHVVAGQHCEWRRRRWSER